MKGLKWGLIICAASLVLEIIALGIMVYQNGQRNEHWAIREGKRLVGQANQALNKSKEYYNKQQKVKQECLEILKKADEETKRVNEIKNLYDYIKKHTSAKNYKELEGFTILVYDWCKEENIDVYHVIPYFEIENEFDLRKPGDGGKAAGAGQVWFSTWKLFAGRFGFTDRDYHKWVCNSRVSVAFAADLYRQTGNWDEAIRRYNGGTNHREKESVNYHMQKYWGAYNRLQKFMKERG